MIQLDLPTLMATESFVAACAGIVLIYAWWQSRNWALLLWGCNGLLAGAGIAAILIGATANTPVAFAVANFVLGLGGGFVWAAARVFVGKRAPAVIVVLGAFLSLAIGGIPVIRESPGVAVGLPLVIGATYLLGAALTFFMNRSERLHARWPVIGLLVLHGGLLGVAGLGFVTGASEASVLGPIGSLFGLIHFESIIFALGTAVFFLAMAKERSELANKVAAHTDGLTGIANRQSFMESAERVLNRCRRDGVPFAVVMFDLDRFKGINDTYGHRAGDDLIRRFARIARDAIRPGDLFGRVGGEEFAVAVPGADIDTGLVRADRIRMDFAKVTFDFGDQVVTATVSGGVASDRTSPLATLLAEADDALYRAKAAGRNRVAKALSGDSGQRRAVLKIA